MKMKTDKIEQLLQKYFNGESTVEDEKELEAYFRSGDIAEKYKEYSGFFNGLSELSNAPTDSNIEEEVMDFILENENKEKLKYRWLWQTVTGIAASVILVLGGFLFYQQQQKPFDDTFKNPQEAYAYARQTLQFVSGKYNKGLAELSKFETLERAVEPIKKGVAPVNEFYKTIEKMDGERNKKFLGNTDKRKSTDSI
jgi:hypothetical protein